MNRRRLRQIVLPIVLVMLVASILVTIFSCTFRKNYQAQVNQEVAQIIGAVAETDPTIDTETIIRALRSDNSAALQTGEAILRQYGLMPGDYATASSQTFTLQMLGLALIIIATIALVLISYFWWLDYRRQRNLNNLVTYMQALSERVYNLRLEENREDELSLLTNELYKITVTLKEAAEQNQSRSQSLETALADISHQLRTPLTSLQVVLDNIYDDPTMPAEIRQDFLRSASRQVTVMSELVTTLLNLAKFDNGSIQLHPRTVKVCELFNQVQQNLEVLADLQDVKLEVVGSLDAKVELDLRWQTEALTNIVKNCIEHSRPGSKVILRAEDCPLYLKITIQDFGEGIAAQDLHHIFERFYKAQNAAAASVGIGLAFAKAIIEASNGQVSAKSDLGTGTKFTITYFK